jgi:hypothetical protein
MEQNEMKVKDPKVYNAFRGIKQEGLGFGWE